MLEAASFTELRLVADIPDSAFQPAVPTANLRWYRSTPIQVPAAALPLVLEFLTAVDAELNPPSDPVEP